jgi:hypothetical protein
MHEGIDPNLTADSRHLDDGSAVKFGIKPVAVGEEEMGAEDEVECKVRKWQVRQRSRLVAIRMSDNVVTEDAR